eukprot:2614812-Prymnesium_polylepis.1
MATVRAEVNGEERMAAVRVTVAMAAVARAGVRAGVWEDEGLALEWLVLSVDTWGGAGVWLSLIHISEPTRRS